jgi:Zn-finger nucleic acid-binding protein
MLMAFTTRGEPDMGCPRCNAEIELVIFEDITVDRCTNGTGIWFDANEQKLLKEKKGSEVIGNGQPRAALLSPPTFARNQISCR